MKRIPIPQLLVSGVLGLTPLAGCSHVPWRHADATPAQPAANMAQADPGRNDTGEHMQAAHRVMTPMNMQRPVSNYGVSPTVPVQTPMPEVQQAVYHVPTAPAPQVIPAAALEEKPAVATAPAGPGSPARLDLTTSACFRHAEDYRWLMGQVEYSRLTNGWRLRYATVDEVDPYGGSVTLAGATAQLQELKDGLYVRVSGHLRNPAAKSTAPAYWVDAVEVFELEGAAAARSNQ